MDRPQAFIVISSASQLPLAEPRGESLSIGCSLVELAGVMERFEDTHEFILATPDGRVPTIDLNVLALAMEGGKDLGLETAATTVQQGVGRSGPAQMRDKHPELVARRESELALLRRHRSLSDAFSLADLDFMYAPGGHTPMVGFHDNPVMGEHASCAPGERRPGRPDLPCARRDDLGEVSARRGRQHARRRGSCLPRCTGHDRSEVR
ncbi:hypothetical protein AB0271_12620 [Kocuria palustris]|uniref:hypothetical protein n=1 Tax=Kocuria palustris TaxID=71999 RepID=UPI00344F7E8D